MLWFVLGAAAIALVFTLDGVMQVAIPHPGPALATLSTACEGLAFGALAASIAMAMLRNRLFDIDRLAVQTFGYGMLVVVATAGYLVVVAVTGAVLTAAGFADVIAPFAAAAVIAVAVHPLRLGLLRLGEHLVLGRRATPYQILTGTIRQVAGTLSADDALPAVAAALAGATAGVARIWLRTSGGEVLAATSPDAPAGGTDPALRAVPVLQGGEELEPSRSSAPCL